MLCFMPAGADPEVEASTTELVDGPAILASIAGLRYVTLLTMQPTRAARTTEAMAASEVQPS